MINLLTGRVLVRLTIGECVSTRDDLGLIVRTMLLGLRLVWSPHQLPDPFSYCNYFGHSIVVLLSLMTDHNSEGIHLQLFPGTTKSFQNDKISELS